MTFDEPKDFTFVVVVLVLKVTPGLAFEGLENGFGLGTQSITEDE